MSVQSTALVIHHAALANREEILSVTTHDIHHGERQSVLGPGRVFDMKAKEDLSALLSNHLNNSMELLSPVCLAAGVETLMWHRPRRKTTVNINGKIMDVAVPSLVFTAHKGRLYVMATQGEKRPDADTRLLVSGMPNVGADGSWCSGGNPIPEQPRQRHIVAMERSFFESPFTHWATSGNPDTNLSIEDWFSSLKGKARFPMRSLRDSRTTLNQWFKKITDNHAY